ncbi:MAG: hypothetical protein K8S98_13530 [Planctomycetes bacterium]|nr:hypothetical protein [Planctomycetota bacterium]
MTGLSALERHLVSVHRLELAFLLRTAAVSRLYEDPQTARWFTRTVTMTKELQWLSTPRWRTRAVHVLADTSSDSAISEARGILEECVSGDSSRTPGVLELAAASMRLEPCDQARIFAGNALLASGQFQSAVRVYRSVLSGQPSDLLRSMAFDNSAVASSGLGLPTQAIEACINACLLKNADRPTAYLNWLWITLLHGDADEILKANAALEHAVPVHHESVTSYVENMKTFRGQAEWSSNAKRSQLVRTLLDRLGPVARRLANEQL